MASLERKISRNYTIRTRINKPVAEVFQALVSREIMTKYFINGSSSDLIEGEEVIWRWDGYGEGPIVVKTIRDNELIEMVLDSREWQKTKDEAYDVLLCMEFEALDDNSTMLSISESGWKTDEEGLKGSHDNCGGWQHMAMCLKAYLEYDIDLR
jgi:uncharacterized protein YndB with AHSA1/START domain